MLFIFLSVGLSGMAGADCPILIENLQQLQDIRDDLDGWYVLIADIDATDTNSWNGGAGFEPIGNFTNYFTGILDGQGHTISNLYINRPSSGHVGLFGDLRNGAEIKNVGLINVEIYGDRHTGALAGFVAADNTISNCYVTGSVTISAGSSDCKSGGMVGLFGDSDMLCCFANVNVTALGSRGQIGGLCGFVNAQNPGQTVLVENCYSIGTVTSNGSKVGGLAGDLDGSYVTVSKCYAAGRVYGGHRKGLIGHRYLNPTVVDSYWDTEASDCTTSDGGIPKTTIEMKQQATFVNWDFTNIWSINEGTSYPFLICDFERVFMEYYVDDDAVGDPGPGDPCVSDPYEDGSSEHPFDSIQEAINRAENECQYTCYAMITVSDGWYEGMGNHNISTGGKDLIVRSEHGPRYTIIDCNGQGRGFIIRKGKTRCTVIDGFTIFDGYASTIMIEGQPYKLGGAIICTNSKPIIQNCDMISNYAYQSGGAIHLDQSNATIRRCEILLNECGGEHGGAGGGINTYKSKPLIENCVVAGNIGYFSGGITSGYDCDSTVINCTISDNYASRGPDGLECYYGGHADVKNSIFWTDTRWWQQEPSGPPDPNHTYVEHIFLTLNGSLDISYSDIEGGQEGIHVGSSGCSLNWGPGNLNADPCFAEYYFFDYHLKSVVGRWARMYESNGDYNNDGFIDFRDFAIFAIYWMKPDPPLYIDLNNDEYLNLRDLRKFSIRWLGPGDNFSAWVQDDVNSPCIDAGDPCSAYLLEPRPNGERINMGAYGNTEYASKSTETFVPRRHPDMDRDDDVDFYDFAQFAQWWPQTSSGIPADFDYSGYVDEADLQEFCLWWLWGKP